MKKNILTICLIFSCLFTVHAQLTYSVVTTGLNTISFDGGGTELECGDVDGDGDLDLASIGTHGAPNINATEAGVMVWKNNGSGTSWSVSKSGNFGYGGVALGDVNNDGKMDVGYAMHHNYGTGGFGDQLIEVALGNGTGTSWTPYDAGLATNGETYGMSGIDFADINNDGLLDLASGSFGCCAGIHAYKNNGNGSWTQTWGVNGGNSISFMTAMADFNRDGNVDMAAASQHGNVFMNDGTGIFSSMQSGIPSDWTMRFAVGDVNNDGAADIAVLSSQVATLPMTLKVYTYAVNSWQSISAGLPNPATGMTHVKIADMDMDGNADLITWSGDSVRIYKGDGSGNWSLNGGFPKSETQMAGWGIGDFNQDGYNDIAVIASGSNTNLKVYLNSNPKGPELSILPVSPKGFECFAPGSTRFVKWLSSVPSATVATVTIELSVSGATGPWTTVVSNVPNSGVYQWSVPNVNSNNCLLKYTITSGSATDIVIMSNPFGIGTCTPPTATNEMDDNNGLLSVYPNPFYETTTLVIPKWNVKAQGWDLKVFDLMGNLVYSQPVNARVITLAPNLSAGVYFVEVRGGDSILKEKIMVVH